MFDLLFPRSFVRTYLQSIGTVVVAILLFVWYCNGIRKKLLSTSLSGRIEEVRVGVTGGASIGRFSGKSTRYFLKVNGYQKIFVLSDASIFENWQFNVRDLNVGGMASFHIMRSDSGKLQQATKYQKSGTLRRPFPVRSSCVKMYGIDVDGKKILSVGSSVRGQAFGNWFWLLLPIAFLYSVAVVFIRTSFKYWTPAAEQRYINSLSKKT